MAYTTIDDPSAHFQVDLHTGDGSGSTETFDGNSDLQPDWLWFKSRSVTGDHGLVDTSRGKPNSSFYILKTNSTNADQTVNSGTDFSAMNSDGYTYGGVHHLDLATNNSQNVVWGWKANGGTTTTNDASSTGVGDQDSVYQANTTAGFSIVTYTGTGSDNEDYAHGLGASPELIIIKSRSATTGWSVNHISRGMTSGYLQLQANSAFASASNNVKAVSSTTFRLGVDSWVNASSGNFVGYFFKSVQGYSKFGEYVGNGNANGPFVYTGFKPAWVMVKKSSDSHDWYIQYGETGIDNADQGFNPIKYSLIANSTSAGASENSMDFCSNGFKIRTAGNGHNTNGSTYVYIAFAEHPFVSSKGVPTTAR